MRLGWWCKSDGGGGIEVSAFFACASRCALRPCTRWVDRTVGVCVLSAPAGFQTSNPRLGFHRGTRNAQDPPKPAGWHVRGRQIRLRTFSSSSSSACYPYSTSFFFHLRFLLLLLLSLLLLLLLVLLFFRFFPPLLRHAVERLVPLWCTYVPRCCGDVFPFLVLTLELSRRRGVATRFTTISYFSFY